MNASPLPPPPDPVQELDTALKAAAGRSNFDMDDGPERAALAAFPQLDEALAWLAENVTLLWSAADSKAIDHQRTHGRLAKTAIVTGTAAIILAVVQLGLKLTFPGFAAVAVWLEGVTVPAGLAAVAVGLWAEFDHQWLGQRHRAERLRMLKFQALGRLELWQENFSQWQQWVLDQIRTLDGANQIKRMEEWSRSDEPVEEAPPATLTTGNPETARALAIYYRHKRLNDQAAYFDRKGRAAARNWALRFHHLQRPMFFATIGCVLVHFVAEFVAGKLEDHPEAAHVLEIVAVWGVVLAAVLPVFGIGLRAYSAAFELSRKARSFAAKHQSMVRAADRMAQNQDDLAAVLNQIRRNETFLEQEHREWLRLLLDVEWFL